MLPHLLQTTVDVESELSDILVRDGIVTPEDMGLARDIQRRTGSLLGTVLMSTELCTDVHVYRALAEVWGSEYHEPAGVTLDRAELDRVRPDRLVRERWVPFGREADGRIAVITSRWPNATVQREIERTLRRSVRLYVTPDRVVTSTIEKGYESAILHEATYGLYEASPSQSARTVLDARQRIVMWVTLAVLAVCLVLFPKPTVSTLALIVATGFLVGISFKFVVCMAGARREHRQVVTDDEVAAQRDDTLPMYTVLVPVYKEKEVVGQLVRNLGALDYPADKLEILLLMEADDHETIEAARASNPPSTMTFVVLPDGKPKTKPKACNVGLMLARGEFLVIYDAEDRPDPDQLRKAVVAFDKAGQDTVCVQAALNYFNADENFLTRMFTLEYSFWFDYMLHGLDEQALPIPLGGTSNHFRTRALRDLGGWDPFNVTEDADLGIRAAARGLRVGVVNSTTYEEANNAYGNWLRQRSRWIKGYLQTVLVHTRHPLNLVRTAGWKQTLSFALLIAGTPLSFLAVLPLYAIFLVSLFVSPHTMSPFFPGWVLWMSLANLLIGNALMVWVSMMGAFRRERHWLVVWGLANPFYWIMHSLSAYKGLWQLITRPHYWEKTNHGLSHVDAAGDADAADELPRAVPAGDAAQAALAG